LFDHKLVLAGTVVRVEETKHFVFEERLVSFNFSS
jgi:hypothetical protein